MYWNPSFDSPSSHRMTSENTGGAKKFLYTGPVKRNGPATAAQFDDDVDDREWNFDAHINTTTNKLQHDKAPKHDSSEFDLDSVWTVKKNITAPNIDMTKPAPLAQGLNAHTGKGYYSRHSGDGAASGFTSNNHTTSEAGDGGSKSWGQTAPHSYSYSYGSSTNNGAQADESSGPIGMQTGDASQSIGMQHQQRRNLFYRGAGAISQGGRDTCRNPKYKSRPI